ncbi:branched-chain amino acid ABC transporter permease, partial [Aduncisulcus paluster]
MGVFVNTIDKSVTWHLDRVLYVAQREGQKAEEQSSVEKITILSKLLANPKFFWPIVIAVAAFAIAFPKLFS